MKDGIFVLRERAEQKKMEKTEQELNSEWYKRG